MIKEAVTKYPIHELISKRWSTRAFSERKITEQEILTLMEAASWAASSVNEQPWEYHYAFNGTDGFNKMLECLSPDNQLWVKNAPALILCTAHKNFSKSGELNRHYMHDTGLANANLITQALSMGIYCHPMGGYDTDKTNEAFRLPEHVEAICYIALGYLGEAEKLGEPVKTRELTPRSRKSVDEIAKPFSA